MMECDRSKGGACIMLLKHIFPVRFKLYTPKLTSDKNN